jgi:hypothetical protein
MKKFDFLLGNWKLEYRIPKSTFSEEASGKGTGVFKKILNDRYVTFDYSAELTNGSAAAHGIFARDEKAKIYRFWWFEDSGAFMSATCNFVNNNTLFMNWHDTLLTQTFTKENPNKIILRMEHPIAQGKFELVLEVIFSKKVS